MLTCALSYITYFRAGLITRNRWRRVYRAACILQRYQSTRVGLRIRLYHRFLQNPDGRYYIGSAAQGAEIPYKNTERLEVRLSDLPSQYSEKRVSDVQPSNCLLPDFIPQLQPHLMLAGKEAFFKMQLTQVQDGCVLGFSVSHGLTGKQNSVCRHESKWGYTQELPVLHADPASCPMEYDQSLMAMLKMSNPGWLRLLSAKMP